MQLTHITINPINYERRIINQARTALSAGNRVVIITIGRKREPATEETPFGSLYRIRSPFISGGPLKFLHFNFRLFFLLRRIQADILHVHDLWVLPASTIAARISKIKLVYDAHEYYAGLEYFNHHSIRKYLWLFAEARFIRHADILLTVSEPLAQKYRKRYPEIPECRVIRNLPKLEIPSRDLARPLPRLCEKMLVYHGHLKPGRGLFNLIRALALTPDTGLVIIGGGELHAQVQRLISELKLSDRIILQDYIDLSALISTSAQADIGVALFEPTSQNYRYALPNKFFEYIMAGLPVLTSNIETLHEYVQKYDVGRSVDPSDPEKIAGVIREMTGDRDAMEKWRRNSRAAAETLNWDNESVKLQNIYEKLGD